ncbi:MAG: nucleotide-binding protein [Alphaproteobacteria bacterium]
MREITIISGKGGTGKTSLTAAFASIAKNHIVCDLDVDAADLHLLLAPEYEETERFISGNEAEIDLSICERCGTCKDLCKFDAIHPSPTLQGPVVDPIRCEGCGVCVQFCPEGAIAFPSKTCGEWYQSTTRFAPMIHAQLFAGEENSGLLVSLLRQKAKEHVEKDGLDIMLCDGSPGIGCPVIASLTGTDLAVIVTEPTPSGFHDMGRVYALCKHFNVAAQVIINKYDLSAENTAKIRTFCEEQNIDVIAKIPHDKIFVEAMIAGKTIPEYQPESPITDIIQKTWEKIIK